MFNSKLIVENNGQLLYNGIKMELFVPDDFFKMNLAEEVGSTFYIFGAVRSKHYFNKDDDRSKAKDASLYYPLKFYTKPDEVTQEKLDFGNGEEKYWVLTYYNNAVFMTTSEVVVAVVLGVLCHFNVPPVSKLFTRHGNRVYLILRRISSSKPGSASSRRYSAVWPRV